MKNFKLFASVYSSAKQISAAATRDGALELHDNSEVWTCTAECLKTAIVEFQNSKLYDDFMSEHINQTVYTYVFNPEGGFEIDRQLGADHVPVSAPSCLFSRNVHHGEI